jgi:hypothetical protein
VSVSDRSRLVCVVTVADASQKLQGTLRCKRCRSRSAKLDESMGLPHTHEPSIFLSFSCSCCRCASSFLDRSYSRPIGKQITATDNHTGYFFPIRRK